MVVNLIFRGMMKLQKAVLKHSVEDPFQQQTCTVLNEGLIKFIRHWQTADVSILTVVTKPIC